MRNNISAITTLIAISLIAISGCENAMDDDSLSIRSFEDQVGTRFFPVKSLSFETPDIYEVPINYSAGGKAIWGAIGRDDQGKLYLGASTKSGKDSTAFLYQYDPSSSTFEPQGDVVGNSRDSVSIRREWDKINSTANFIRLMMAIFISAVLMNKAKTQT
jgi:hypothetical protein